MCLARGREAPDNFGLAVRRDFTVARKGRQAMLVAEILRPSFETLGVEFPLIGQLNLPRRGF